MAIFFVFILSYFYLFLFIAIFGWERQKIFKNQNEVKNSKTVKMKLKVKWWIIG